MMWLKSCPRCATGDMYLDEDDARHCLQCGYTQESAVSTASSGDVAAVLETIGSVGDLLAPEVLLGPQPVVV